MYLGILRIVIKNNIIIDLRTKFLFGNNFWLVQSNVFIYYFIIIIFTGLEKKFPVTHHQPPPDRPKSNHHRRDPPQTPLQTTASHPDTLTKTQPATTETPVHKPRTKQLHKPKIWNIYPSSASSQTQNQNQQHQNVANSQIWEI